MTPSQAYKAKTKAKVALEGVKALKYKKLWDFGEMIRAINSGSYVKIICDVLVYR